MIKVLSFFNTPQTNIIIMIAFVNCCDENKTKLSSVFIQSSVKIQIQLELLYCIKNQNYLFAMTYLLKNVIIKNNLKNFSVT